MVSPEKPHLDYPSNFFRKKSHENTFVRQTKVTRLDSYGYDHAKFGPFGNRGAWKHNLILTASSKNPKQISLSRLYEITAT